MMKHMTIIAAVALAASSTIGLAQNAASGGSAPAASGRSAPVTDSLQFVQKAASANMFEIESSKLALQKAKDQDVKDFAQKMIDDHTRAGQALQAAAGKKGIAVPKQMAVAEQHRLDQLKSADDFQTLYIKDQLEGHDQTVSLFKSYLANGPDGPLRSFDRETLPRLEQHLKMIHKIAGK